MTFLVGPRERAIFSNSLASVLLGIIGHSAVVELKIEAQVSGKVTAVDCFTNISMENAVLTRLDGTKNCFTFFFIPMRSIRAVQIPDYISVPATLNDQINIITGKKHREERMKLKLKLEKQRANRKKKQAEKEAKLAAQTIS